jgi:hypothetical protein
MEPLERIHLDLWGKAQMMSLGGAYYMMLAADGGSDMKFPFFLTDKRSETIIHTIEGFRRKAELQTGQKIKII